WQGLRGMQGRADSDTQRKLAQVSERQARANLKKAREAVDQMLLRVADRLKDEPQMEQVRRTLLEDALTFYGAFLQQDASDPELQYEAGMAHLTYGMLQGDLGQLAAAEQTYSQAIGIFQNLVAQSPENLEYRQQLDSSYLRLGNILKENSGRMADAETAYRKALEIA